MKKLFITALAITLFACSSKKAGTTTAAAADDFTAAVNYGATKYPGYTLGDLTAGKTLYEGNCGSCHNLKKPTSRNEAEWKHEVADMVPKVNKKAGKQVLGDKEQDLILKYLVAVGTAPKPGK